MSWSKKILLLLVQTVASDNKMFHYLFIKRTKYIRPMFMNFFFSTYYVREGQI